MALLLDWKISQLFWKRPNRVTDIKEHKTKTIRFQPAKNQNFPQCLGYVQASFLESIRNYVAHRFVILSETLILFEANSMELASIERDHL